MVKAGWQIMVAVREYNVHQARRLVVRRLLVYTFLLSIGLSTVFVFGGSGQPIWQLVSLAICCSLIFVVLLTAVTLPEDSMTFYLMKDGIGYYEMHHLSQRLSFIFDVCSGQALWDHMIPYREISRATLVETAGAKNQEQWQKTGPQVNPYTWLVLSFTSNGNERVIQIETKNGEVHGLYSGKMSEKEFEAVLAEIKGQVFSYRL